MRDKTSIRGRVRWTVRDAQGRIKTKGVNHNIVTNSGDALIADLMSDSPARVKVDNTNGQIGVGTGFVSEGKDGTLVAQTGSYQGMEAGYPQTKGAWGAADDNVVQYRSIFAAGSLDAAGIDEAELTNSTDVMAYAEISPSVTVGTSDTLQIDWEITILGA